MSLEVLLIPIGIAAYGAIKEARSSDLCEKCKATRITEIALLIEALNAMGATVTNRTEDRVQATSRWGELTFQKVGDLFLGRVDRSDEATTRSMLDALDAEVGRIAQHRTAELAVARARELGFRLIEQREENGTINYVFEEAP